MDSVSVLGQQSPNKIRSDYMRLKNEENRTPEHRPSKNLSVPQFFKKDVENKNTESTGKSQKTNVKPGSSRLPVLAKSLNLQTSKEFAQSHKSWEHKPLAGKAKSKKPCTKPVPFNFSQPRSKGTAPQNQRHPDVKTMHQNTFAASVQALASQARTEACLNNLDLLSIKDSSKKQTLQAAAPASSSSGLGGAQGKEEPFQLDHAALLTILRDEGVAASESTKPHNYLPQRVSVMKSHQKVGPSTGPMRVTLFSLDPAAMQSTQHGEGVTAGGTLEKTPSNSARPTGRDTPIYTARRVPVTKPPGVTPGKVAVVPYEGTPNMKWTPQRVPNTRNHPMAAMASMHKRCLSARPTSHNLPACTSEPQPHDKDVVQRLFDDQDETVSDEEPDPRADQLPGQASTGGSDGGRGDHRRAEAEQQEEKKRGGAQPFLQEPHRESVIFFSTGKKLFRAPRVEKPEAPVPSERGEDSADTQRVTAPGLYGKRPEFDPSSLGKPFASSLQRDFLVHKSFVAASPAMALRLNRCLPLEKLWLDQEVATYTCRPVAAAQPLQPQRSRCGNPLASFLHFQESTTFCPVGCDGSPASPRR